MEETSFTACHMLDGLFRKDDKQHWYGPHPLQSIDPSDNSIKPKFDPLSYGFSRIQGKVWITFQRDMHIVLEKSLLISSFTTIDGREIPSH
ncbi:Putative pectate lyase 4 [Glycine soja]|uniref:Putative pectate lyase 4 n=1 Tax=Glycine soja TaxID=3848 RepID=A0A0B2SHI8_GLYSO|nr:Putative pectate lyase 4 [Glycine soja]